MSITIRKIKLGELLSIFALALFLFVSLINTSFYARYISGSIYYFMTIISVLFLIVKELISNKFNIRNLVSLLGILFVYLLVGSVTGFLSTIAISILFIFGLRDISFTYVARVSLYVSVLILLFVIISSEIGYIPNYVEVSLGRVRHFFGIRYSLFPSTIMLNIVATTLFLARHQISYKRLFFYLYQRSGSFFRLIQG